MKNLFPLLMIFFACSCAVGKNYNPSKKFSPEELREDYTVFRNVLEESHPSLYWYTPKDSIDHFFEAGAAKLSDSLTENKFRYVLTYVLSKIRCGHTTARPSKKASAYAERTRGVQFPLSIKAWDDTVVITSNLSRKDSTIMRGALLRSIDGKPIRTIIDTFFQHLSADGFNTTHKYQTISNTGVFRNMYSAIYGLKPRMNVEYIDTSGIARSATMSMYVPVKDTTKRTTTTQPRPTKRERKKAFIRSMRSMRIDTSRSTAFMEVNSFSKDNRLRSFFRQSFKQLHKEEIKNLVVDMRGNGGGSVTLSNLLTKYLADKPFVIADSLYAINNRSSYGRYQSNYFLNRLFFIFMARKKADGYYHFSYFEHRRFKPKTKNHFAGSTYILTGGNTFSAAALFAKALKDQDDVVIVGEETGGGSYGNTAWLIPDVTLPHTKVRFRLPLFRLVIDANGEKGRGIIPEVESKPTVEAIRHNADFKIETVEQLIRAKNKH